VRSIQEIQAAYDRVTSSSESIGIDEDVSADARLVDDAIDELAIARERIALLRVQSAQCRRILLNIRKIAAFIPGDIGAKLIEAMAPIDEIEANERKIEALAKREATQ
jgi:hypothetical protein